MVGAAGRKGLFAVVSIRKSKWDCQAPGSSLLAVAEVWTWSLVTLPELWLIQAGGVSTKVQAAGHPYSSGRDTGLLVCHRCL